MKEVFVLECSASTTPKSTLEFFILMLGELRGNNLKVGEVEYKENEKGETTGAIITLTVGKNAKERERRRMHLLMSCTGAGKPYAAVADENSITRYYRL